MKNKKDAAGRSVSSEENLVVSCKALLQLQKSLNRKLTTSDQHVHVVLVVVAVLNVHIVVVIVVVVVVIVIVVVVIVQVIVVSHSYHCHKDGRQECKQAEMILS